MALARCELCGKPKGRIRQYVMVVLPVEFPSTSIVCGSTDCEKPGKIWLDVEEAISYRRGERVFHFPNQAAKVRVQDGGVRV